MPSSSTPIDLNTNSFPWRLANILAIASPYLIAAALFLFLYLDRPSIRTAETAEPVPTQTSAASGTSVPVIASSSDAPNAATNLPQSVPQTPNPPGAPAKSRTPAPAPAAPSKPAPNQVFSPSQPVPVDPAVAATMKVFGPPPAYPAIAQAAGIQGAVVVEITVSSNGSVSDARAIGGPALLQPGTVAAVRSWRYRPWLVYGKATPFVTQISINFIINTALPHS